MNVSGDKLRLMAAAALLVGAAACGHKPQTADASLAADLKAAGGAGNGIELAPAGNPGQVVVSPLEGGPQSAPKKAAPHRVYKPVAQSPTRVAAQSEPATQAAPQPTQVVTQSAPAPQTPQPAPVTPAPTTANRPAPVQAQQRQPGVYKTEGEIFQKMPWIRP
jgi:hypothetical protein